MSEPNRLFRAARERTPSQRVPGACMSRQEVAEEVNAWLHECCKRVGSLDDHYVGKIERGVVRWPGRDYRAGFRVVLGAATDADLGFSSPVRPTLQHADIGMCGTAWHPDDIVAAVETSTREDLANTRRRALAVIALAGQALTQPLQRWLEPLAATSEGAPSCALIFQ